MNSIWSRKKVYFERWRWRQAWPNGKCNMYAVIAQAIKPLINHGQSKDIFISFSRENFDNSMMKRRFWRKIKLTNNQQVSTSIVSTANSFQLASYSLRWIFKLQQLNVHYHRRRRTSFMKPSNGNYQIPHQQYEASNAGRLFPFNYYIRRRLLFYGWE